MKSQQDKGLKRNTIDKFYTKPVIVGDCIELIKAHLSIAKDNLVIEPSAGNGSFIEEIKKLSDHWLFFDIEPENSQITKQDFLELDCNMKYENIHIIGNPPFGHNSSLAIKFIKKSCSFAKSISFILPKSFKKDSMKKYFTRNFHLVCETDLPENSFFVNNIECDVPCVFQIWKYSDELRKDTVAKKPTQFTFVKKEDQPDISFRRVGINAGTISKDVNKSYQSHYFIKFTNDKTIDENLDLLKNVYFSHNNTVGPKSISKQELISEFERLLN